MIIFFSMLWYFADICVLRTTYLIYHPAPEMYRINGLSIFQIRFLPTIVTELSNHQQKAPPAEITNSLRLKIPERKRVAQILELVLNCRKKRTSAPARILCTMRPIWETVDNACCCFSWRYTHPHWSWKMRRRQGHQQCQESEGNSSAWRWLRTFIQKG